MKFRKNYVLPIVLGCSAIIGGFALGEFLDQAFHGEPLIARVRGADLNGDGIISHEDWAEIYRRLELPAYDPKRSDPSKDLEQVDLYKIDK